MTLHDREELDDDLRRRTDKDLALAAALRVDNVVLHEDKLQLKWIYHNEHTKQSFFTRSPG